MNGNEHPADAATWPPAPRGIESTVAAAAAAALEVARIRGLAALASTLMHDLNNHLTSCLALAMQTKPSLRNERDIALHDDLCRGVHAGADLTRALVRMLARADAPRRLVPVGQLLDDALAAFEKSARLQAVSLQVVRLAGLPMVRTLVADATYALLLGFTALLAAKPARLEVVADAAELALAGGRRRCCARVRTLAIGIAPAVAAELAAALNGAGSPGVRTGLDRGGLLQAAIVQRVLGGELLANVDGSGLELVHAWPASV